MTELALLPREEAISKYNQQFDEDLVNDVREAVMERLDLLDVFATKHWNSISPCHLSSTPTAYSTPTDAVPSLLYAEAPHKGIETPTA